MLSQQKEIARYHRSKTTKIKHIESESESDVATYQEKESQRFSLDISVEYGLLSNEEKVEKQRRKTRQKTKESQFSKEEIISTLSKWEKYDRERLPEQCLNVLKENKKGSFQEISFHLESILKGSCSKKILFLHGQPSTGKKSLLFIILSKLHHANSELFRSFWIDIQSLRRQKAKEEVIKFHNYLSSQMKNQTQQSSLNIFIINTFQSFYFFIKKANLLHQIKKCLLATNTLLIFVDKYQLKTKKDSWFQEQSLIVEVETNSIDFLASSLTAYINNYPWRTRRWKIKNPLSLYFCTKMMNEGQKDLNFISKFQMFLQKQSQSQENNENLDKQRMVTRQQLQRFKESFSRVSTAINITKLSVHEKLILISCYRTLNEEQQVRVPIHCLVKVYTWACQSLSLQPRTQKQLFRSLLPQMQTYKLIKTDNTNFKSNPGSVLLLTQLSTIENTFEKDDMFSKFFQKET